LKLSGKKERDYKVKTKIGRGFLKISDKNWRELIIYRKLGGVEVLGKNLR